LLFCALRSSRLRFFGLWSSELWFCALVFFWRWYSGELLSCALRFCALWSFELWFCALAPFEPWFSAPQSCVLLPCVLLSCAVFPEGGFSA
jgi:hypothetical protein